LLQARAEIVMVVVFDVIVGGVIIHQRAEENRCEQRQHQQRQPRQRKMIEQESERTHDQHKTDRSPRANRTVIFTAFAEMRQRQRLELRHDRVVAKTESAHRDEQSAELERQQKNRETRQCRRGAKTQPADRSWRSRGEPAPRIRRDDARGIPQADQHTDRCRTLAALLQEQTPERQKSAERGVVGEIKTGQTGGGYAISLHALPRAKYGAGLAPDRVFLALPICCSICFDVLEGFAAGIFPGG